MLRNLLRRDPAKRAERRSRRSGTDRSSVRTNRAAVRSDVRIDLTGSRWAGRTGGAAPAPPRSPFRPKPLTASTVRLAAASEIAPATRPGPRLATAAEVAAARPTPVGGPRLPTAAEVAAARPTSVGMTLDLDQDDTLTFGPDAGAPLAADTFDAFPQSLLVQALSDAEVAEYWSRLVAMADRLPAVRVQVQFVDTLPPEDRWAGIRSTLSNILDSRPDIFDEFANVADEVAGLNDTTKLAIGGGVAALLLLIALRS